MMRESEPIAASTLRLCRPFSVGRKAKEPRPLAGFVPVADFGLLATTAGGFAVLGLQITAAGVLMVLAAVILVEWRRHR